MPRSETLRLLVCALWLAACAPEAPLPEPETPLPQGPQPAGFVAALADLSDADSLAGVTFHHLQNGPDDELFFVAIESSIWRPTIAARPERGIRLHRPQRSSDARPVPRIALGSGFVRDFNSLQPLGLLQLGGAVLTPVEPHGYTRILGLRDETLTVVHRKTWSPTAFESALQLGPGIIEQGQLDISERDLQRTRYFRSVLAVCDQRWVAGISLVPMHLRTLGESALKFFSTQGWTCPEMVNLAGDRQAALVVETASDVVFHGNVAALRASYVAFEARALAGNRP